MGKDANHRGVGPRTTRFARLDHEILRSAAYRSLSPNARALLVEFSMLYNTRNNGALYLSVRDGAARIGLTDLSSASNAFGELMSMGFIDMTLAATFTSRPDEQSRARCWRITWEPAPGFAATHDYRHAVVRGGKQFRRAQAGQRALSRYQAGKSRGAETDTGNPFPVLENETLSEISAPLGNARVRESRTGNVENRPIPVDAACSVFPDTSRSTTSGLSATPTEASAEGGLTNGQPIPLAIPRAHFDRLRRELGSHLSRAGHGAQSNLATDTGIPTSVLSKFRHGGNLPGKYFVPLSTALNPNDAQANRRAANG